MSRQASAAAYAYLIESGRLSRARAEVYAHVYNRGPQTRNELDAALAPGQPNPTSSRRLADLERMGLMYRVRVRPCKITGRNSDEWDVTDRVQPLEVPEKLTAREALKKVREIVSAPSARTFSDNTLDRIERVLDEATEAA